MRWRILGEEREICEQIVLPFLRDGGWGMGSGHGDDDGDVMYNV